MAPGSQDLCQTAYRRPPLESVTTADLLDRLEPRWAEQNETAIRLKQRLSTIFDWAKAAGYFPREKPVNGVKWALPTVRRRQEHRAAMPWQDVPTFMIDLVEREGISARCLEFLILTAAPSIEAGGARWDEIDLKKRT